MLNRGAAGRSSLNLAPPPAAPAAYSGRCLVSNTNTSASSMAAAAAAEAAAAEAAAGVGALPPSPTRSARLREERPGLQEAARADVLNIVGAPGSSAGSAGGGAFRPSGNVAAAAAASSSDAEADVGAGVGVGVGTTLPSPPPSPPSFPARRGSSPPRVQHEARLAGTPPRRPWSGTTLPASPPGSDRGSAPAPDAYRCPIGHGVMTDPVTCADGHSYQVTAYPRPSASTLTLTLALALTLPVRTDH